MRTLPPGCSIVACARLEYKPQAVNSTTAARAARTSLAAALPRPAAAAAVLEGGSVGGMLLKVQRWDLRAHRIARRHMGSPVGEGRNWGLPLGRDGAICSAANYSRCTSGSIKSSRKALNCVLAAADVSSTCTGPPMGCCSSLQRLGQFCNFTFCCFVQLPSLGASGSKWLCGAWPRLARWWRPWWWQARHKRDPGMAAATAPRPSQPLPPSAAASLAGCLAGSVAGDTLTFGNSTRAW